MIFQIFLSRSATTFSSFLVQLQDKNWNSSFLYMINYETIQSGADVHLQNSLPGKDIVIKTIQPFLWIVYATMKSVARSQIFLSRKFSKFFVHLIT